MGFDKNQTVIPYSVILQRIVTKILHHGVKLNVEPLTEQG